MDQPDAPVHARVRLCDKVALVHRRVRVEVVASDAAYAAGLPGRLEYFIDAAPRITSCQINRGQK